ICAGVGAFVPRTLKLDGIERFVGSQVHYQQLPPGTDTGGRHVVIQGGDEAAVACALALAERAGPAARPASNAGPRTTLLHRRDAFQASDEALARLQALRTDGLVHVVVGQITGLVVEHERLAALELLDAEGASQRLPV